MDPDPTAAVEIWVFTVCRCRFKRQNQTIFWYWRCKGVNNYEFSVETVSIFMKCMYM